MSKRLYSLVLVLLLFCGCATNANFIRYRDYDVGRSVDLCYDRPSKIISHNQNQDKYFFESAGGCQWVYYVNKKTKTVESWEYVSDPDKCTLGYNWWGSW